MITASLLFLLGCEKQDNESDIETLSAEMGPLSVVFLSGWINGLDAAYYTYTCGIEYSTDSCFLKECTVSIYDTDRIITSENHIKDTYTITLTGLTSGQKYYYRAYYYRNGQCYYGEVKDFSFTWDLPQITTLSAERYETDKLVLIGVIKDLNNWLGDLNNYFSISDGNNHDLVYPHDCVFFGFEYSTNENFDANATNTICIDSNNLKNGDTIFCCIRPETDTQYYYRVFFILNTINVRGCTQSFRFVLTPKDNGFENGYQFVEMGLSVKWATYNVGATQPQEYGDYYAWGEIETKRDYSMDNYKWAIGGVQLFNYSKYCSDSYHGAVDNKSVLDREDDVAHVKWGGNWRMPTNEELEELLNNCSWTWTKLKGVNGFIVKSNKEGYTDRSIFLPAAGYRSGTVLYEVGYRGQYWTSSLDDNDAYAQHLCMLHFDDGDFSGKERSVQMRCWANTVRPVCQ